MTYPTISEYVESILSAEDNFKELTNLRPVLKADGTPYMINGGFAVVFKMKEEDTGKLFAVKCFLKEQKKRTESYKLISEELEYVQSSYLVHIRYMEDELFVDSANSDQNEFPILLMDWVEGEPLDAYLRKNLYDEYARKMLAYRFCAMSSWLMSQPFAHGDLKPDNILVREDGTLVLVDYDGMFVPAMKGQTARELGSPDFRHPLRENTDFDEHIDDFSIASIALSLKAISLDADLLDKYGDKDRLLFSQTDYQNISASQTIAAMQSLLADVEFERLIGVFILAHSMKNLSAISFRAIQIGKPEKVEREQFSTEVTKEEIENGIEDEFGVIYSRDGKRLLACNNDELSEYVIKRGTKVICKSAFYDCWDLTSIEIPDSVTSIGSKAFSGCGGLTSIEIPDSVTSIGSEAFSGCGGLTSIEIPDSVTSIGDSAFKDCRELANIEIPNSVTSIGESAFYGCENLTSIEIPDSVTSIGNFAFVWSGLTNIEIPDSVTSIGDSAFVGCWKLTSIEIPNSVTSIGDSAFKNCWNLMSIVIPDSVTSIGSEAFSDCGGLTSIEIPDSVTSIRERTFNYCSGLTRIKVSLDNQYYDSREDCNAIIESKTNELIAGCANTKVPDSVTSIGKSAFYGCENLTSIEIPDSVTSIGESAFYGCENLTSIEIPDSVTSIGNFAFVWSGLTNIEIPDSVTSIGDSAFECCWELTKIEIPNSVTSIGESAFGSCEKLTNIAIPDSVTSIGNGAFYGCENLTSIEIPDSVMSIGEDAFWDCENLTSIEIPDSVTSIGDSAFHNCRGLTSIEIPASVTSIGNGAFRGCEKLTSINVSVKNQYYDSRENCNAIIESKTNELIAGCVNTKIPDSVTSIGAFAFSSCYGLPNIMIPDSVTSIGEYAFLDCWELTSIKIPGSVMSIGKCAFAGCGGLTSIKVSLNNQYYDSRENCNAIIESKTNELIAGCVNTKIPNSVTSIGNRAFSDCRELKSIEIPDSVTSIGDYAFSGCGGLTSIVIPDSVTSIGDSAFDNCRGLTSIEIPDSVMSIGNNAFEGCDGLIKVKVSPKNKFFHTDENKTRLIETKTGKVIWKRNR